MRNAQPYPLWPFVAGALLALTGLVCFVLPRTRQPVSVSHAVAAVPPTPAAAPAPPAAPRLPPLPVPSVTYMPAPPPLRADPAPAPPPPSALPAVRPAPIPATFNRAPAALPPQPAGPDSLDAMVAEYNTCLRRSVEAANQANVGLARMRQNDAELFRVSDRREIDALQQEWHGYHQRVREYCDEQQRLVKRALELRPRIAGYPGSAARYYEGDLYTTWDRAPGLPGAQTLRYYVQRR